MNAPFRQPSDNPEIVRAIEALKQAQTFLHEFAQNVKQSNLQRGLSWFTTKRGVDETLLSVLDQNHAALWNLISEARTQLAKAGHDVGPKKTIWGGKSDIKAPARDIERLKALLPGVDFTVHVDSEVEDYLVSQSRSRVFWKILFWTLVVLGPIALTVLLIVCGSA